jgi:hypothetical protein
MEFSVTFINEQRRREGNFTVKHFSGNEFQALEGEVEWGRKKLPLTLPPSPPLEGLP